MSQKIVAIGADHAGYPLKTILAAKLAELGYEALDLGTSSEDAVDYPDFAAKVVAALKDGRAERGVLVCGSGIGMSIAANRHGGIRAALCRDAECARLARRHNDANVLVLGGRVTGAGEARRCLEAFLETAFDGGRHAQRVEKLA